MALPLPSSLSPSRVSSFTSCPLSFRFSTIDGLPDPPGEAAVKGTTVHRALELLFTEHPGRRTRARADETLDAALEEVTAHPDFVGLDLDDAAATRFVADARRMVDRYFELEDPDEVRAVGLELKLEARLGDLRVRGVIDRLELDDDGELVVTDYKTGRAPRPDQERSRMAGVHIYSLMVSQVLGRRPSKVRLVYLGGEPQVIEAPSSERSVAGAGKKLEAVWAAVERACANDDFRPKRSALCRFCSFQQFCPEFGGDPAAAVALRTGGPR